MLFVVRNNEFLVDDLLEWCDMVFKGSSVLMCELMICVRIVSGNVMMMGRNDVKR